MSYELVSISDDDQRKFFEVFDDDSATPQQLWDAATAARGPAVDAGVKACNAGTHIGPCGVTHFGTAIVGFLFHVEILQRVQEILEEDDDPGYLIAKAGSFMNEAWEVSAANLDTLVQEREDRVGRY